MFGSVSPRRACALTAVWALAATLLLTGAAHAAPAAAPWEARHNLSSSQYQAAFNQFNGQGLRLVSVSGYTVKGQLRYAALWRKLPGGPAWAARHGMSAGAYQKEFNAKAKAGYRLVYVQGYEYKGKDLYAAIWEQRQGPAYVARHGLTLGAYNALFKELTKKGHRQLLVSGYTKAGSPRYAAIFEQSAGPAYLTHPVMSAGAFQKKYDEYGKQGFRLRHVTGYHVKGKDVYAAHWEKVGGLVLRARSGIPAKSYQRVFDSDRLEGYAPTFLQGFSSGGSARFNALWETTMSSADVTRIKDAVNNYLKTSGVPGVSVAIAKEGRLVYAAGHGLANIEAKQKMDAFHLLRIGSVSKTVTGVAVHKAIEEGRIPGGLSRKVFGPGGILSSVPIPASMKPLEGATLGQFLGHTSGLNGNLADPVPGGGSEPYVPCKVGNVSLGLTTRLGLLFKKRESDTPLLGAPGEVQDYSNVSQMIAEAVIEKVTGTSYASYVRARVLAPSGISRAKLFGIGPFDPKWGEAVHYDGSKFAEYPADETCEGKPPGTGAGGWAMSAKDLLRFYVSVDGRPERELLKQEFYDAMVTADTPTKQTPARPYSKSWFHKDWGWCNSGLIPVVKGHNGALAGGVADLWEFADGYSIAVVATRSNNSSRCLFNSLRMLAPTVDWPEHDLF